MVTALGLAATGLVISLYFLMDGWVYRRPWILLALGLLVAWAAVVLKATPIMLKSVPNISSWTAAELELAASVVDPTLIGLAGGLIASAFIAKLQFAHDKDVIAARKWLSRTLERVGETERADEDLKLVAASLSNEEFHTRLREVQMSRLGALTDRRYAEEELRRLDQTDV